MYYPLLRGRVYELLAVEELIENNKLSNKTIPIIEPVKANSSFKKFLEIVKKGHNSVGVIMNPQVGSYFEELKTYNCKNEILDLFKCENIHEGYYAVKSPLFISGLVKKDSIFMVFDIDYIDDFAPFLSSELMQKTSFNLLPYDRHVNRLAIPNKVVIDDPFGSKIKKPTNGDYPDKKSLLFSDEILYFLNDGYSGFSDYSIVGKAFSETGFTPKTVVIHIVYFDAGSGLNIIHFKSSKEKELSDTASKFGEALKKLVDWNNENGVKKVDTLAMKEFEKLYEEKRYPGLGVIKKLCIMNHLEIVDKYLNEKNS